MFKLFIFPLAFRCLTDKLLELGILPNLGYFGTIASYMLINTVIGYTYSSPPQPRLLSAWGPPRPERRVWSHGSAQWSS